MTIESPDDALLALAGKRVRVDGERRNGAFVASGGASGLGGDVQAAVTGTRSVAVLLFNFSNNTAQPWTSSHVRGVVFDNATSVDEYLGDASYGQLALSGNVHGWYTIDASNAGCSYTTWASQARSKATAAGVNLAAYQHIIYAFPQAASCGWAGLAYLPGSSSWINGAMTLRVVSHELSHNLGVHHASTLACSTGTFTGSCSQSEYGDPFTVMGAAQTRLHVNWHRAQLGWLADVQTVTASGSYVLAPAEFGGTPRLLRIARGDGTYLNLEYRQPTAPFDAFAAGDAVVNGVSIRIAPDTSSIVQSKLVDARPSTATFSDAALPVAASVTDPLTGAVVTTISVSPSQAVVAIDLDGDTEPPTGPSSLTATALSSTSVQLSWPAASDDTAVLGYRVYRNGAQIATTSSLSRVDSPVQPAQTYAYEVRAFDAAGNLGAPASASVTTPTFADVPPTNPFYEDIEQLYDLGITTGCGQNGSGHLLFCPSDPVPRQQMAAFLMRAKGQTQLVPATPTFADVPASNPFYGWIERLYQQGVTTGCGTNGSGQLLYCPGDLVPRQQMAAFLMRAKGQTQLVPATPTFADVPASNPFYGWIERLYQQGVTTGCGTNGSGQLLYCPGDLVTRQQMAAFLIRAFAAP